MRPLAYLAAREQHDKVRGDTPAAWITEVDRAHLDARWCRCGRHRVEHVGELCPCCREGAA